LIFWKSAKISVARTTSSNTDKKLGIANRSKVDIPTPADMSARDPRHKQSETKPATSQILLINFGNSEHWSGLAHALL